MSSASGRKLPQSTYDAVVKLCQDKTNTVFVVSGLNDKGLMQVSLAKLACLVVGGSLSFLLI